MKRLLKWLGIGVVALVAIALVAYATRTDPIGPIAGRALSGEIAAEPVTDWSFTDGHPLIAVETRPAAPHSVTTVCLAVDGVLYVPAQRGAEKSWTHYAVADPRVRVKVGDRVYPARATRVDDPDLRPVLTEAAKQKYDFEPPPDAEGPSDVWIFRIDSAPADVAAGPM